VRFNSVEQAIRFAFNVSERAEYSKSDPLAVRGTSLERTSPMDLHAQAAMIQSMIGRLAGPERDAVLAMYGRGRDRTDAVRRLAEYLAPNLRGVLPSVRDVQIVILHWATKRPSIRKIAEERGVSYRQVCGWRTAVLRSWIPVQCRAVERLHERMFGPGGFELRD
jgi:hypothetical protein